MKTTLARYLATAVIGLLVLSAVVPAPGTASSRAGTNNDTEPNDLFADAGHVTMSTTFTGVIDGVATADGKWWDIFKFWLNFNGATGDRATVNFTASEQFPGVSGVRSFIYAPGPYAVGHGTDDAVNQSLSVTATVSGFYYVGMEATFGPPSFSATTYSITFAFTPGNAVTTNGHNDPANATVISSSPFSNTATIDSALDQQDFYRVTLASTAASADMLMVTVAPPAAAALRVDVFYASNGSYVNPLDDHRKPPAAPNDPPPQTIKVTYGATASGDYLIRVWAITGSGSYTLKATKVTVAKDGNIGMASAKALDFGGPDPHTATETGEVGAGIDNQDYFSFPAYSGTYVNASILVNGYDPAVNLPVVNINIRDKDDQAYGTQTGQPPKPSGYAAVDVDQGTFGAPVTNYVVVEVGGASAGGGSYALEVTLDRPPRVAMAPAEIVINESGKDTSLRLATLFVDDDDPTANMAFSKTVIDPVSPPDALAVTIGTDAQVTVTMTPKVGWTGNATVLFNATDPYGRWVVTTVPVRVAGINHAPYLIGEANATGTWSDLVLKKNTPDTSSRTLTSVIAEDDLGDVLAYNVTGTNGVPEYDITAGKPLLKAVTFGGHLRVSFQKAPNGLQHSGGLGFSPTGGWTGEESLEFWAQDNGIPPLQSPKVALRVIVNTGEKIPPEWRRALPGTLVIVEEGRGRINLTEFSNDPDGGPGAVLSYNATADDASLPVSIAPVSKALVVAPTANWTGKTKVHLVVTDADGLTDNATVDVEVTPVPDAPVITAAGPTGHTATAAEGGALNLSVVVVDSDTGTGLLLYKWTVDGKAPSGAGGSQFVYKPDFSAAGPHPINVSVNDSTSGTDAMWGWVVTVTDTNRPPALAKILKPENGTAVYEKKKFRVEAAITTDPDGDTVSYEWQDESGAALGIDPEANVTMKRGKHQLVLVVKDGKGGEARTNITIKVLKQKTPGFETAGAVAALAAAAGAVAVIHRRRRS